ncbi:MAG TPA: pseudouridine synthase [Myxococcota bacterium]|nr:pseudouridine synthase [Myxococcota bacterium]HQK50571.1 pseudouridine synthase [Myxococcota bacterium]
MTMRLQRYLADALGMSRRRAEELVAQGRVTVNGVPADLGRQVDPAVDRVQVDGERVKRREDRIYLVLHKPRETICSERDPEGRRSVFDLLPALPVRVHAIGRLDFLSEGLLLFTNDGLLTRELTRRSRGVERVYEVKVQGGIPQWALERLVRGVRLDDGMARAREAIPLVRPRVRSNIWVRIVLDEGRYREVRRMFQAMGFNVLKLKRVQFGPIRLGSLPPGAFRYLREAEVETLVRVVEDPGAIVEARAPGRRGTARTAGSPGTPTTLRKGPGTARDPRTAPAARESGRGASRGHRQVPAGPGKGSIDAPGKAFEALVERAVRQAAAGRRPRSASGSPGPRRPARGTPRGPRRPDSSASRSPARRGGQKRGPTGRPRNFRQKV